MYKQPYKSDFCRLPCNLNGIGGGGVGVLLSFCFKSKCSECVVCGKDSCFFFKRDVQAENEESKMEMEHMPFPRRDPYIV